MQTTTSIWIHSPVVSLIRKVMLTLVTCLVSATGHAAVLTVTSSADSGPGTLRNTVAAASAGDVIQFALGNPAIISLTSGQIYIGINLTIIGPGPDALAVFGGSGRAFYVNSSVVVISGLKIAECHTRDAPGGAIYNNGTLTLTNCILANNSVEVNHGGLTYGGAICNFVNGSLTLDNCTVSNNIAANLTAIAGPTLGAGIYNWGGTSVLNNCTVSGNIATAISDVSQGGGLANGGIMVLNNCTVASNYATGMFPYGGGVITGGTLSISNSTIAGNSSAFGGGIYDQLGNTKIQNTIIANNDSSGGPWPDVYGNIASQGFNLVGKVDSSSGWIASDLTGSISTPLNPMLGPLANNGGLTLTMAIPRFSPAVDRGFSGGTATDQRGVPRHVDFPIELNAIGGDASDIGAYEIGFNLTLTTIGNGSITKNPDLPAYYNQNLMLTAMPAPGWSFAGWAEDDGSPPYTPLGSANPLPVLMNVPRSIIAIFVQQRSLTIITNGAGIVLRAPNQSLFDTNSVVTVTAVPLLGWAFAGWSGDATGAVNPLQLVMSADKTITANFTSTISDLIVDNTNATFTGSWTTDNGPTGTGFFAQDFHYATTVASATATATFRPTIPLTGSYDVYVWYPLINQGGRRCQDAQHLVSFQGGAELVSVNQNSLSGNWRLLRTETKFVQGTTGFVQLSNQSADSGDYVAADAIRWVWSSNQVVQPFITGITRNAGAATVTWLAAVDQAYRLQYKTNLTDTLWLNVSGDVVATGDSASKSDISPGNTASRFYRVGLLP